MDFKEKHEFYAWTKSGYNENQENDLQIRI